MTQAKSNLQEALISMDDSKIEISPATQPNHITWNEFQYKEESSAPKISFTGMTLVILCPILICAHIRAASLAKIPIIQFTFCATLFSFLINYTAIIRKYQLRPFLPQNINDSKLKRICLMGVIGLVLSMIWGWNGSGGLLFAITWEQFRGNKFGTFGYMLAITIVGSLLMEHNFEWLKLVEFIPGILFGLISASLFTLRQSSVYAIAHQFLLLTSVVIPMLFPAFHVIVPNLWQWLIMIIGGVTTLFTTVVTIKLMQSQRVSVVIAVMSGLLMIGTSNFNHTFDYIGTIAILIGIVLIIKKQYIDLQH